MIVPDLVKAIEEGKRKHTMNNRIKLLALQCTYEYSIGIDSPVAGFDKEKFAELIVRECASIVYKTDTDHADGLALLLLHTFRVEE